MSNKCSNTVNALALALIALAMCACTQTLREQPSAAEMDGYAQESMQQYVIGPRDQLTVNVWRQQEISVGVEVRNDGKISIPLLDDVQAAGLTPNELKTVISERLEAFITEPQVTVVVTSIRSKVFYVLGEVNREGTYPIQPSMRIVDAIAAAAGLREFSVKERIKLIRTRPTGETLEFEFDYPAFVRGENLEQNILLLPGDRVIVPEQSAAFWR